MNKNILLFIILFFLLVLVVFLFKKEVQSPLFFIKEKEEEKIVISGTLAQAKISGEETWTKDKNPYLINSDLEITKDGSLIIEPGVIIYITSNKKINIDGKIAAGGNRAEPVYFILNNKKPEKNKWQGIDIKSGKENVIKNASIKSADSALNVFPVGKIEISENIIEENIQGIFSYGILNVKQNTFRKNGAAITIKNSRGSITENVFDNNNIAVFIGPDNSVSINNNFFKQNNELAIKYAAKPIFYLGGNYFETANLKEISKKIYDANKKSFFRYNNESLERGVVIFEPFLKEKSIINTPLTFPDPILKPIL